MENHDNDKGIDKALIDALADLDNSTDSPESDAGKSKNPTPTPAPTPASASDNATKQMVVEDNLFNDFDSIDAGWLVGASTNQGIVRGNNEDSIYAFFSKIADTDTFPTFGIFIVADGAGGHLNGEVASSLTLRTVAKTLITKVYLPMLDKEDMNSLDRSPISNIIGDAIREADTLVRLQVPDGGCTCTVGVVIGNILNIGHVGDSRLYVMNETEFDCVTRDHSVVGRLVEIGEVKPEDAKSHPQRSVLYRGVGMGRDGLMDVDISRKRLKTGDRILLCSDGLWDMIDDELIQKIVIESVNPQIACKNLITKANMNGGEDNISVIVVASPDE